ncbi:MAG: COX15/CtaA family protein [Cyclobacteriaceae bacterium]|nr:COX15/CtaA family protein [Cyclobacteriaceae bacterium]
MKPTAISGFYKLCLSTLIAVFFLILVGGIVRSTGSGMGCPDWPKCFGQWIPPTSVEQLPTNYKEEYSEHRQRKNQTFARYLSWVGMDQTARQIVSDPSIKEEADFNAVKTWIEYVNRVIGVVIGLFIVALFWQSIKFRHAYPRVFWLSGLTLVAVIVQGWFGSIVVSTNLTTWTISVHMFVALFIVGLLVYLFSYVQGLQGVVKTGVEARWRWLLALAMILLLIQVFLGTRVREQIDVVASRLLPRNDWISAVWADFLIHRSFSWSVMLIHVPVFLALWKSTALRPLTGGLAVLLLCNMLTGVVMAYFDVPAAIQPVHLLLGALTFGWQWHLFLRLNTKATAVLP